MSSFNYFGYLAQATAEFLSYFGIVTIPLLMIVLAFTVWASNREGVSSWRVGVASIAPAIIPIGILCVGVAFVRPEYTAWGAGLHPPVPWFARVPFEYPQAIVAVLQWLHLPMGLGVGWWAQRGWPAAAASTVWWGWVSVFASATAEMSITGSWI